MPIHACVIWRRSNNGSRARLAGLVALEARAGTALVWAAGLVHGGGPILDPASTRWSQVTHFYFADCVYYAPIFSNLATGDLYLKRVVDVATGEVVPHRYRGLPLPDFPADGAYKLVLDVDDAGADRVRLVSNYEIKHLADDNAYLRGVKEENANLWRAKHDLEAAIDHIRAETGVERLYTIGFCMGGRLSFLNATYGKGLAGVIGMYGWPVGIHRTNTPAPADVAAEFECPVLAIFGGADEGIPKTARTTFQAALHAAGVPHRLITYENAPHSFFDRKADEYTVTSEKAWGEILRFVRGGIA